MKDKKILLFILSVGIVLSLFVIVLSFNNRNSNNSLIYKDVIAPVVTDVTLYSNNSINKYFAYKDDVVRLTFKFNEKLKDLPLVKINDCFVSVTKENDKYVAEYKVLEQKDIDYDIVFEISNYSDIYNNKGSLITQTTDNSKVTVKALNQVITPVELSNISFDNNKIDLTIDSNIKEYKLNLIPYPLNATLSNVLWTSSNYQVCDVNNEGIIKIKGVGNAVVTASVGNLKAEAVVNVYEKEIRVNSISIGNTSGIIYINSSVKTLKLTTTVSPDNSTNKNITWKSSNPNVATVLDGVVTAKSVGSTTITASCDGKSDTVKITVTKKENPVTSINLDKTSEVIYLNSDNKSIKINAKINPDNATDTTITWKSSDTSVATVKDGVVTAKGLGSSTITATCGGKSATVKITVKNQTFPVENIILNKTSDTVYLNGNLKTINLTANVEPSNATDKTVIWSSSDNGVATVNNGVVNIKGIGSCIITAQAGNKKASYTLNVRKKIIVIVGASQVKRLNDNNDSYTSINGYNYNKSDNTLKFIFLGGSGIPYQYVGGEGWNKTLSFINEYSSLKQYIDFHIFFPLSGNEIKEFTCSEISSSNSDIKMFANGYNKSIQNLKNQGYHVKGYVTSMHPVRVTESNKDNVVSNNNKNSCVAGYRSNVKYYTFNKAIKSIIDKNYQNNLLYEPLFIRIMNVNDEGTNFSFKWDYYHTDDGIHWDSKTSQLYLKEMLDYSKEL